MTRVFIYEHMSWEAGRLPAGSARSSMHSEGSAMLSAVLEDFRRVEGVEAFTLDDGQPGEADLEMSFRAAVRSADFTLVIAPESGDRLLDCCRWAEEEGGQLLGPGPAAVQLTGDKFALGEWFRERGVPTPPCWRAGDPYAVSFPALCKPRHGAGSQATFFATNARELPEALARATAEANGDEILVQPWVEGTPASAAFLMGPRQTVALLPAAQLLSEDGRFHYLGGAIPLPPQLGTRAVRLAYRAVTTVPGLRGYVGVDLVLGAAEDGSADWAIEINPRLTTSYVGLRRLAEDNLAEISLRLVTGDEVPPLSWRSGSVNFRADGQMF